MKKIFIAFVFLATKMAVAQTAATNTGVLYITGSSDIFCAGSDFTNNSGSSLTNNGQLYIKGNTTNDQSSMTIGTGTLYLNGSSAQSMNGSQTFKTYHLNTNNSFGFTLNNNLSVSGTHTFTSGIITTSATPNYLIYEAGSSYTGDADSRHVNGWVKKMGTTDFIFPVGNNTIERNVALTSLSVSSEFNAKYASPTPNIVQLQLPLKDINTSEYWIINKVSGGSALVAMNWNNAKVAFPNWILSQITSASYNSTNWIDIGGSAVGNVATTGNISSNSVSSFNLFAIASKAFPVPLTLIDFSARRQNNYSEITWTTVSEYNVDHFSVERSEDNLNFYSIEQVKGRNSPGIQVYLVKDYKPLNHIAFYRLKSIDIDGKQKLSKVVAVTDDNKNNRLLLLTNPVHDKITLTANGNASGLFNYVISNSNGQLIQDGILSIQTTGKYDLVFNKFPAPGFYLLTVKNAEHSYNFKFVVK